MPNENEQNQGVAETVAVPANEEATTNPAQEESSEPVPPVEPEAAPEGESAQG